MERKNILVIEDEVKIARFVELELVHEGYAVHLAHDGLDGLALFQRNPYDLVILDVMLPKLDGLAVLSRIREASNLPVIMLTAKGEVADKVTGLDAGADDYVTKPFAIEELLARMRAALKTRPYPEANGALRLKGLRIDTSARLVTVDGQEVDLTKTEYELLACLVRNKNVALTREQIISQVWGYDYFGETNVVDVYIRYLRAKIEDRFGVKLIHTVRGVGYIAKDTERHDHHE